MTQQYPIIGFNFDLATYIDESWLKNITHGDIILRYKSCKYAPQYISKYLMKYFEIDEQYEFDIPKDIESFSLLPPEKLISLVQYAGAILNSGRIQKVILRKEIENLKLMVGEDAYYFGLRRSPMFKDIYSDLIPGLDRQITLGESTVRHGVCCLLAALGKQSNAIKQRVLFKLPFSWANFENNNILLDSEVAIVFLNKILGMVAQSEKLNLGEVS